MIKRRIKNADILFLSLVPRGKNRQPVLYKADDQTVEFQTLCKAGANFDETGELLTLVYVPGVMDKDGHHADADEVRKMAHSFAKNGSRVDVRHNKIELSREDVYPAESFIVQEDDKRFKNWKDYDGNKVNATGAWATIIKIDSEEYRQKYRNGDWNGVSMYGPCEIESIAAEEKADSEEDKIVQRVFARLENQQRRNRDEDIDMKKEELVECLKESNLSLVQSLKDVLKPEAKKEDDKDPKGGKNDGEVLKFEGDHTNLDDVRKHQEKLEELTLRKGVDFNDTVQVSKYIKALEDRKKTKKEEVKPKTKASNQPITEKEEVEEENVSSMSSILSKEDLKLYERGVKVAEMINKQNGFKA